MNAMPPLQQKIVDTLIKKVKKDYQDDIDLIVVYGSYITGNANPYSDVDFYFVPKTDRAFEMCTTFIIDGIGYDFWPIGWERLKGFADFSETFVSLLGEGVVVYARTIDCEEQFLNLQLQMKENMSKEDNGHLMWRIDGVIEKAKAAYYNLTDDGLLADGARTIGLKVYSELLNAVAYLNGLYVKKGNERFHLELERFKIVPHGFGDGFNALLELDDVTSIRNLVKEAIGKTETIIRDVRTQKPFDAKEALQGCFEELKSTYNKIYHGIEIADMTKCFFGADGVDRESKDLLGPLYKAYPFPILTSCLESFEQLHKYTKVHEALWRQVLKEHGVKVNEFDKLKNFESFMKAYNQ